MKKYLWLCFAIIAGCTARTHEKRSTVPPNIIYIIADDLGYGDLGCYGQQKIQTPNIDKLAQEGMLFTQHYSGSTVCAPSRSVVMTGQHTGHTPIRGNREIKPEGQYPLPDSAITVAEMLKGSGYATGAFGKWGLGYPASEGDPVNQGFDTFYGYNCQRLGHHYYPRHLWHNRDSVVLHENSDRNKGQYAPALIHEQALQFIEKNHDTPFFLYRPTIIPHAELAAPEEYMDKSRGGFGAEEPYVGYDEGPEYRSGPYESQQEPHTAFAAMVDLMDQQVGQIMHKLEELGIADRTIIIFTSDNGPHREGGADPDFFDSNGPLRGYKRDLYEGGIRVPMIVRWPGQVKAGSRTDHISAFWDVFPTLAGITSQPTPDYIDGISFLPTLLGQEGEQSEHEYLYWEFHEKGGRVAARADNWKAVKYDILRNPGAPVELYDLSKDPGEQNDLSAFHPERVTAMEEIFSAARVASPVFSFDQDTYLNSQ
ncbi:arylsulfatase [Fulvivirga sp. M361]|uniref:arylsulfatase n=1 Tax=Fulvivirga sp. M361 TaxID=2594266 RepID=UPI001179CC7C|nr:arylsulfatase [Fulvivirga sp. M361]TRX59170.1 arylsulfatase [Fulvivirga sp. M361]